MAHFLAKELVKNSKAFMATKWKQKTNVGLYGSRVATVKLYAKSSLVI